MDGVGLSSRERLCESARPAASARPGAARACAMRQALQGGSGGAPPCPVALGELESPSVKAAFATHKHFPHTYTVVLLPSSSTSPPSELRPSQYRSGSVLDLVSTHSYEVRRRWDKNIYRNSSRPEPFRVWWSGLQPRMAASPPDFVAWTYDSPVYLRQGTVGNPTLISSAARYIERFSF